MNVFTAGALSDDCFSLQFIINAVKQEVCLTDIVAMLPIWDKAFISVF